MNLKHASSLRHIALLHSPPNPPCKEGSAVAAGHCCCGFHVVALQWGAVKDDEKEVPDPNAVFVYAHSLSFTTQPRGMVYFVFVFAADHLLLQE